MKHTLSLAIAIVCLNATLQAGRAVVVGNVSNIKAKTASTSYNNSLIFYNEVKQDFAIDKKGNFKLEFNVSSFQKITMVIHEQQTSFYVQPGDSMTLKINYADFDKSIVFSGRNSEKNNLMKSFDEKFVLEHEQDSYIQNVRRTADKFAYYCDSMLSEEERFINAYAPKPGSDFLADLKTTLLYGHANDKLNYAGLWSYGRHKGDTMPEMPANYYDFMKKLPLNNDTLLGNSAYFNYLKSVFFHYQSMINQTSGVVFTSDEKLQMATALFKNDKITQAMEASFVHEGLRYDNFADAEKFYQASVKRNPNTPYSKEINELHTRILKVSPGQMAPDFTLADEQGKQHSLAEFKGKVVYLDFWASWCGPCMREMPFSKKLKKEFENNKNVAFLYVSVDEDPQSWKDAIIKQGISGTNLIAPAFDHPICTAYNINGVPTYFLIDKNGRIVNNNPSRPSAEEAVKKEIYDALQK